jgi:hypothetical protein
MKNVKRKSAARIAVDEVKQEEPVHNALIADRPAAALTRDEKTKAEFKAAIAVAGSRRDSAAIIASFGREEARPEPKPPRRASVSAAVTPVGEPTQAGFVLEDVNEPEDSVGVPGARAEGFVGPPRIFRRR